MTNLANLWQASTLNSSMTASDSTEVRHCADNNFTAQGTQSTSERASKMEKIQVRSESCAPGFASQLRPTNDRSQCGTLDRLPSSHHRPKKDVNAFIEGFDNGEMLQLLSEPLAVEPNQCNLSECKVGDSSIATLLGRTRITRMRRLSFRQKLCTCSSLRNKSPMAEEGAQGACHVEIRRLYRPRL